MSDQWGPTPQQPDSRDPQRGSSWQQPGQGYDQPTGNDPWGTDPYATNPYDSDPYGTVQQVGGQPRPSVSFNTAIKLFFKNYAVFRGRASRSEYWYAALFLFVVSVVFNSLQSLTDNSTVVTAISGIWGLATFIPSLAVGARRLHDTNRSGWWQLIGIIPIIGWIVLIIFLAQAPKPEAWERYDTSEPPASS